MNRPSFKGFLEKVKKRTEIKKIISEYQARLQALGIEVSQIILYGSYAQRKAREYSDIDIAVISPTILPRIPLPPGLLHQTSLFPKRAAF